MSGGEPGGSGAKNIGVIVMDPKDGSVLAMPSNKPYDLNNPRDLTPYYSEDVISAMSKTQQSEVLNSLWQNYCISESFEPGSTVKPLVVAAAMESGVLTGSEVFDCDGVQNVSGRDIKCSNNEGHGEISLSGVIELACNDGIMEMAEDMGV